MRTFLSIVFIFLLNAFSKYCLAQELKLDKILNEYENSYAFSGSVLLAEKGNIIHQAGYGLAEISWQIPNKTDTKFVLGSISKSITSVLILKLQEEGLINLQDKIVAYFPQIESDQFKEINIHHLLNNTSGIPNFFMLNGWKEGAYLKNQTSTYFTEDILSMDSLFAPGSSYHYSNSGYYLLGQIIEKSSGLSYATALEKFVLEPLNMTNTGIRGNRKIIESLANAYIPSEQGSYMNSAYLNLNLFTASANTYSNTYDLFLLHQAIFENNFLKKESLETLLDSNHQNGWTNDSLQIGNSSYLTSHYNGQLEGYSSLMIRLLDKDISLIILANNNISYATKLQLSHDLLTTYLIDNVNLLPSSYHIISKSLYENKLEEGIKEILSKPLNYSHNEDQIMELAQQLSWTGGWSASEQLYILNTQLFPESHQALLHLGEFYLEQNKFKKAQPIIEKLLVHYPHHDYFIKLNEQLRSK